MNDKLDFNSVLREKPEKKTTGIHVAVKPSLKRKLQDKAYYEHLTLSEFLTKVFEKAVNYERE